MKQSVLIFVASLFAAISANAALTESEGCFLIGSSDDLYEFAAIYNSSDKDTLALRLDCAKLTQDIVVNENVLTDGGNLNEGSFKKWESIKSFYGTFDGQNHTVSGLYQEESGVSAGFFREVKGVIKNLGIVDSYFGLAFDENNKVELDVGALAATYYDSLIVENCFSSAMVETSAIGGGVGGLIGGTKRRSVLKIRNSHNDGRIVQHERYNGSLDNHGVGGLVGDVRNSEAFVYLEDCYNRGNISGNADLGGLVGAFSINGNAIFVGFAGASYVGEMKIDRCYNSGEIRSARGYTGGLAGRGSGIVNASFNSGDVAGEHTGGLVGQALHPLTISNSYNRGNVVGSASRYGGFTVNVLGDNPYIVGGFVGDAGLSIVNVSNSYNASKVVVADFPESAEKRIDEYEINSLIGGTENAYSVEVENVFYLKSETAHESFSIPVLIMPDESLFNNGAVAMLLRQNYEGWGQEKTGNGNFPDLSGTVKDSVSLDSITWNTFDGDTNQYPAYYVEGAELLLPVDVPREGYLFDGWYAVADPTDRDSRIERIKADETGAKKLYAKWLQIKTPPSDSSCYLISNVGELYSFAAIVNGTNGMTQDTSACGKLTQDIVVNEQLLDSEGKLNLQKRFRKWTPMDGFNGIFDGNGYTIYGLYFDDRLEDKVGFFGNAGTFEIKNLGLEDFYIRGGGNVGAFVGYTGAPGKVSLITNSYSSGVVVGKLGSVGGLVGHTESTLKLSVCWNKSLVYGVSEVGGLVGNVFILDQENDKSSIRQCYNAGQIYASLGTVGGLVGAFAGYSGLEIKNAYNTGRVDGFTNTGGILGRKWEPMGTLAIYNTYNAGKVSFVSYGGAIVGEIDDVGSRLDNCFYLKQGKIDALTVKMGLEPITTGFTAVEEDLLYDGSVATSLREWKETDSTGAVIDGDDGLVWAKDPPGVRVLPHFVSEKDSISSTTVIPVVQKKMHRFGVDVVGRNLQVAGARAGDRYVLFDMQGNVVLRGTVNSANFNVAVPVPGNYVLRIGHGTRKVTVGF